MDPIRRMKISAMLLNHPPDNSVELLLAAELPAKSRFLWFFLLRSKERTERNKDVENTILMPDKLSALVL